jgi:hypothetical protein
MTKNSNFEHNNICTRGSVMLKYFIEEMQEKGWAGKCCITGDDTHLFYCIDEKGYLRCGVSTGNNHIVKDSEFIEYYRDMLAPIESEEKGEIYAVTRTQFKKIHDVACDKWKKTLTDWCNEQTFGEVLTFSRNVVESMLAASSTSQKEVILSVFDKYEEKLDLSKMSFKGDVFDFNGTHALISINGWTNNSFFLNKGYTWEITTNEEGFQILTPTRK